MNLQPINASASPEVQLNENFETLDHQSVYGLRQPVTTGLTWGYCGGRWGGFAVSPGTLTLTDAADNYVVVAIATGAISVSTATTNWDDDANYVRVYKITTASSAVTAVEDHRAGPQGVHGGAGGGGGGAAVAPYTDPARLWYGPSGVAVDSAGVGYISGDAFLVWDGAQWILYFFRSVGVSPYVKCYYRTAATLVGTWSSQTEITSLAGYHKLVILVDELGEPAQVGGEYHAYAVYYNNTLSSKEIFHFTASSLTGSWSLGSKVIPKGGGGDKDEYNTDTPYALYKDGTVYLWYMGAPTSSVADYATFGYAIRMLRATATDPDGPFTKSSSDVLAPSVTAGWDYGWMGGVQVRKRPDGSYLMVYNAGDTRPSSAGTEPNTSRIGYANASSLDGPWARDSGNPYAEPTGWPANGLEKSNIWRGHIAYDPQLASWFMFWNTGSGTEVLTYGIAGVYDYFDTTNSGAGYEILTITTSLQTVTNSRVNVSRGVYLIRYAYNVGDLGTTKPAVDIDITLRFNGSDIRPTSREFIGSYNYENRDVILMYIVSVKEVGYFDVTVKCTGGTPTGATKIRRGRVMVERIKT